MRILRKRLNWNSNVVIVLNLVLEFVDVMAHEFSIIVRFLFKMGFQNVFNVCLVVC